MRNLKINYACENLEKQKKWQEHIALNMFLAIFSKVPSPHMKALFIYLLSDEVKIERENINSICQFI